MDESYNMSNRRYHLFWGVSYSCLPNVHVYDEGTLKWHVYNDQRCIDRRTIREHRKTNTYECHVWFFFSLFKLKTKLNGVNTLSLTVSIASYHIYEYFLSISIQFWAVSGLNRHKTYVRYTWMMQKCSLLFPIQHTKTFGKREREISNRRLPTGKERTLSSRIGTLWACL